MKCNLPPSQLSLPGVELPKSDPGGGDVFRERAPEDQQVKKPNETQILALSPPSSSHLHIIAQRQSRCRYIRKKAAFALWLCSVHGLGPF